MHYSKMHNQLSSGISNHYLLPHFGGVSCEDSDEITQILATIRNLILSKALSSTLRNGLLGGLGRENTVKSLFDTPVEAIETGQYE